MAKGFFSGSIVSLGTGNINILSSEVWNDVVNLPGWLIPRWLRSSRVPWDSTSWWSERNSLGVAVRG